MKGRMHKLYKASALTHRVPRPVGAPKAVREDIGPPRPAAIAERLGPIGVDDKGQPVFPRWTLVHTGAKQEFAAVGDLKRAGYAAYCPVITRWVRIGRKRTIRHIPLFPRYVFVGLKEGATKSLNSCTWGRPLALDNGKVTMISGSLVYALSEMQEAGIYDEAKAKAISEAERTRIAKKASAHFSEGDTVTITSDAWEGFNAQVVHAGDDERVTLLINLFGRASKVHVRLDQIRPAA